MCWSVLPGAIRSTLEAGVKYLILSALSTGFLVYGITWIFGVTGETNLERIATCSRIQRSDRSAALFGMVLVLVALGFKIAAVPFQIWVPDVYQGAPTPVTAYPFRRFEGRRIRRAAARAAAVLHAAADAATACCDRAAHFDLRKSRGLPQTNLKRLLAYSSIAHAGYLLIGVASFRLRQPWFLSRRLSAHDAAQLRCADRCGATNRRTN